MFQKIQENLEYYFIYIMTIKKYGMVDDNNKVINLAFQSYNLWEESHMFDKENIAKIFKNDLDIIFTKSSCNNNICMALRVIFLLYS